MRTLHFSTGRLFESRRSTGKGGSPRSRWSADAREIPQNDVTRLTGGLQHYYKGQGPEGMGASEATGRTLAGRVNAPDAPAGQ